MLLLQLESAVMPYLSVLSDFRADVRKIAREQKGEQTPSVCVWNVCSKANVLFSDAAAADV